MFIYVLFKFMLKYEYYRKAFISNIILVTKYWKEQSKNVIS